ncbi:MAG: hydantoinase/oxoprolinase family protein [Gemmatimonadota bacterium]
MRDRDNRATIGWDVGGANLKAVRLQTGAPARCLEVPFETWRAPEALSSELAAMARDLGPAGRHAVTMTAELADCFASKRDGVAAVLESLEAAVGRAPLRVFTTTGRFTSARRAAANPLEVAGANWCASATWLAAREPAGVLADVGSTTTDLVPFAGGRLLARGRTDTERLVRGELVYTGAQRTPVCAILRTAPLRGRQCPVAAEHFAVSADAHLWLGDLAAAGYRCATPDGGPVTRAGAAARLARVVCGDLELLGDEDVGAIARAVAGAQVRAIAAALARVCRLLPGEPAVFTSGSGAWLAERAAERRGLEVTRLDERLGEIARMLPAFAVARLLGSSPRTALLQA